MDVSRYFLTAQDQESGELITNLKLQKLLYYAQGYYLALFGEPLFADEISAWPNGPVVKSVYEEFKDFGDKPIPVIEKVPKLPDQATEVLRNVLQSHGQYSAWKLRDMTHKELPYLAAAKHQHHTISPERMQDYFRAVLSRPLERPTTLDSALRDREVRLSLNRGLEDAANGRRVKWGDHKPSLRST
jgi:uncharacterized phage-associated protein